MSSDNPKLPPGQQLVAAGKWPIIGEKQPGQSFAASFEVTGQVANPRAWSLSEAQQLPSISTAIDIHCVTRWSKLGVQFRGVPLSELIQQSSPLEDARFISMVAHSDRGHSTSLPLDAIKELQPLLAWEADGEPLPVEHGGPLRVVVPGRYFYKSVKWLARVELLAADQLGFWESTAGYHNTADPWLQQRYLATNISKQQARDILERKNISKLDLRGIEAAGLDLNNLVAKESLLRNANFRGAILREAAFDRANLSNAVLTDADLRGASFREADLEGADLTGADLRGADLLGASLVAATLVEALSTGEEHGALIDSTTRIDRRVLDELTPPQAKYLAQKVRW